MEARHAGEATHIHIGIGQAEHASAWALLRQVNKRSFTIVDASSAALMQRDGVRDILALDPEFRRLGLTTLPGAKRRP